MKSATTSDFRDSLRQLPLPIQRQAVRNYRTWRSNSHHPGIQFKKVNDNPQTWSARIGIHYRALAALDGETFVWFWIGSHSEYDQILKAI